MDSISPQFLYPTEIKADWKWFPEMLAAWHVEGKPLLCFPFKDFRPRTLPEQSDFWMFMYYRKTITDIEHYKGKVQFRVHVLRTFSEPINQPDVFVQDFGGGETIWFLCDQVESLTKVDGSLLDLEDFAHVKGSNLPSTLRRSIAPVICSAPDLIALAA